MSEAGLGRHRDVVLRLYVLLRAAETHPARSPAIEQALDGLSEALEPELVAAGKLVLHERGGGLSINGHRLGLDVGDWAAVEALLERLHRRGLAGFAFEAGVSRSDLLCLAGALSEDAGMAQLARAGLARVQLLALEPAADHAESVPALAGSQLRAVFVARRLVACIDFDAELGPREQQRMLSVLAELLLADADALQAFTELEGNPEGLRVAVARCVRASALGRELGLPEPLLRELAVASLLEPLGTARLVAIGGTSDAFLRAIALSVGEREGLVAEIVNAAAAHAGAGAVVAALGRS